AGALTLAVAAGALAGPRGPEFPISIAEARDRMEARFKEIDSDGSGEISPAELAAAPRGDGLGAHGMFMHRRHGDGTGSGPMDGGRGPGAGAAGDADLFERLDSDGDGQLSEAEFD